MTPERRAIDVAAKWRDEANAILRECREGDGEDCSPFEGYCWHDVRRDALKAAADDLT